MPSSITSVVSSTGDSTQVFGTQTIYFRGGRVYPLGYPPDPYLPEPSGWRLAGFDDSGWAAPLLMTIDQFGINGSGQGYTGPYASWVTSVNQTDRPNGEVLLFRWEFSLPAGTITAATFSWASDNAAKLWLNGTLQDATNTTNVYVIGTQPDAEGYFWNRFQSSPPMQQRTLQTSMLLPGQTNCVAMRVRNGVDETTVGVHGPDGVAFQLNVTQTPAGAGRAWAYLLGD